MEETSHRESRSRTLIECLRRLHEHHPDALHSRSNALAATPATAAAVADKTPASPLALPSPGFAPTDASTTLTIHLVGADHREGNTGEETCTIFNAFFQSLALDGRFTTLQLVLVGPNIARLLHQSSYSHTSSAGACQVELRYFVGSFDDYYLDKAAYVAPDLAVCFNAGIWGYDEWLPSLALLLHTVQTPLLVTSYNANEAMDDEDVLETLAPSTWFWRAEKNPHGSLRHRATSNSIGSVLKENDYWMCLGPAAPVVA